MQQSATAATKLEPQLTMVVLRGCRSCGDRHPLAYNPPRDPDACPKCGAPSVDPEPPIVSKAELTGPFSNIRNLLRKVAR